LRSETGFANSACLGINASITICSVFFLTKHNMV